MNAAAALVVESTLLLVAAAAVARCLERRSASLRHAVWALALLGSLFLCPAALFLPRIEVPILAHDGSAPPAVRQTQVPDSGTGMQSAPLDLPEWPRAEAPAGRGAVEGVFAAPEAPLDTWTGFSLLEWLVITWALGGTIVLARLGLGSWAVRRLARKGSGLRSRDWTDLADNLRSTLGIRRPVRLRLSDINVPPMTWGVFRPVVLFPADAAEWSCERRELVLAHELAHIRRRDPIMQVVVQAASALYWFNPLVWYAAHRIRAERERAADDHVLSIGIRADRYADHLVEIARSVGTGLSFATVSMAHPSQLEARLLAILDPRTRRQAVSRFGAAFGALLVLLILSGTSIQLTAVATPPVPRRTVPEVPQFAPVPPVFLSGETDEPATLAGVVVRVGTGEPLGNTRVELTPERGDDVQLNPGTLSTTSGPDGRFRFDAVPPATYRLVATRTDGFMPGEYGQRSATGAGMALSLAAGRAMSDVRVELTPTGTISGRVFDVDGNPVGRATVEALRRTYLNGLEAFVVVNTVESDDRGDYRLFWLPPDRYYISVRHESSSASSGAIVSTSGTIKLYTPGTRRRFEGGTLIEEVYLPTYFPATTDEESASPIELGVADHIPRVDVVLQPPTRAYHVRGKVVDAVGQPAGDARLGFLPVGKFFASDTQATFMGMPVSDGRFDIPSVVPGSYLLTAGLDSGEVASAPVRIDVGNADVNDLTLALVPGIDIPIRVRVDGTPPGGAYVRLTLVRSNGIAGFFSLMGGPGSPMPNLLGVGSTLFRNVQPGQYRVAGAFGTGSGVYLESVRTGSRDLLRDGLVVVADPPGTIEVVIGTNPGTVEGRVVTRAGEPAVNVEAVLVPDRPDRHRSELYRSVSTRLDGRFTFDDIAPGAYHVFAWPDLAGEIWRSEEFLLNYEPFGEPVHVREGSTEALEVRLIPAVP